MWVARTEQLDKGYTIKTAITLADEPIAYADVLRSWQQVGAAMQHRLNAKPVWLSTAGAGVAWLHVRLDDRPKYYGYAPYRASS